jgi:hypothetical protein
MKTIYRGYDIEEKNGGFVVTRNGQTETSQPSAEFAMSWVDQEKRRLAAEAKR